MSLVIALLSLIVSLYRWGRESRCYWLKKHVSVYGDKNRGVIQFAPSATGQLFCRRCKKVL